MTRMERQCPRGSCIIFLANCSHRNFSLDKGKPHFKQIRTGRIRDGSKGKTNYIYPNTEVARVGQLTFDLITNVVINVRDVDNPVIQLSVSR